RRARAARRRGPGGLPASHRAQQGERHGLGSAPGRRQDPRPDRAPRAPPPGMTARLLAAAVVLSVCTVAWAATGDQTGRIAPHLALYGAAFAAYRAALDASACLSRRGLRLALCAAFLWRAVLVGAPPLLSDDVYRSVWEGRIQLQGGNPYAWRDRPASARWESLRDEVWARMNHKDYTAIYPPF